MHPAWSEHAAMGLAASCCVPLRQAATGTGAAAIAASEGWPPARGSGGGGVKKWLDLYSSAEDAPWGMSFLYNPSWLNVATSRARCVCILMATGRLLEPDGRTPEQMLWANGLCHFRELATLVDPAAF